MATAAFFLIACQKTELKHAATLDRASLMELPFPGWRADAKAKIQSVNLSALAEEKNKASEAATRAEVTPIYVVKLDDTHATLLTQTLPVNDGDEPIDCHACSGTIGAYFFEQDAAGWQLTSRQDAVAQSGVQGHIGDTSISKLTDGHFALTAEWGSCWQGYCGSWLVVVGLQRDNATLLAPGIPLSVDNDGAHGACSALDAPEESEAEPNAHECMDIRSKWKFQGNRLVARFEGRLNQVDSNGKPSPTKKIQQQAVYEVAQGQLSLVKGTNPVPGF